MATKLRIKKLELEAAERRQRTIDSLSPDEQDVLDILNAHKIMRDFERLAAAPPYLHESHTADARFLGLLAQINKINDRVRQLGVDRQSVIIEKLFALGLIERPTVEEMAFPAIDLPPWITAP
jgi:hypothetical protein